MRGGAALSLSIQSGCIFDNVQMTARCSLITKCQAHFSWWEIFSTSRSQTAWREVKNGLHIRSRKNPLFRMFRSVQLIILCVSNFFLRLSSIHLNKGTSASFSLGCTCRVICWATLMDPKSVWVSRQDSFRMAGLWWEFYWHRPITINYSVAFWNLLCCN